ncbi:MAG TPA: hypothetical protein VKA50_05445 [Gammaproteobacteria bacterium]|nr:hypothetical protein [Gammaproteobacteria bacterium]
MTFFTLACFFVVASAAFLAAAWLSAEIKSARPDLTDRLPKPWLFTGYTAKLLELSAELLRGDGGDRYPRIRSLARAVRLLQAVEWVLLAAFFVLLLLHAD